MGGNTMPKEYILTENEKKLLEYAYTDNERIQDGLLFDYQIVALKMIRKCQEYLNQKYPNQNLEMVTFSPQNKKKNYTEIHFIKEGIEPNFILRYEIKDGKDYFSDNFYDVPYIKDYDKRCEDVLNGSDISARCFTIFPYLMSDKVTSAEELFNVRKELGRNTEFFISVSDLPSQEEVDKKTDEIEQIFTSHKIYMNGMVYFILDLEMDKEAIYYDKYVKERMNAKNYVSSAFRTRV